MNNDILKFSINDIHEVSTENSDEFCYARICVLSTKPNSHQVLITDEILRRDGLSVRGKWIVCDFDGIDATTHTNREKIVGIVPHDAKVDFIEEDGYTSMYVDAIISKIYAKEIYDMFKIDNFRNVSVEMMTKDEDTLPNGDIPIKGLKIVGITILGRTINGSCPNANMSIVKFSIDEAEDYYKSKQFAEEQSQSHEVDKSKESVDMGDWDGDKAKDDLIKEKNFKTVAKSVCLLLEDGWEDKRKGSLKYPVMNLKNGKWVYNAKGLASARAYGEQHNQSIADKAISIQKKLGLYEDDKEGNMSIEKNFSVDIGNIYSNIYDILEEKYPDEDYGSIYRIEGIYEDNGQKFVIVYTKADGTLYKLNIDMDNEHIVLSEEMTEVERVYIEKDEVKKFADENVDSKFKLFEEPQEDIIMSDDKKDDMTKMEEKDDDTKDVEETTKEMETTQDTKKSMSEQAKEFADEEDKEFISKLFSCELKDMVEQIVALKKFQDKRVKQDTELKLKSIMASVKEDIETKQFSELQKEGESLTFEELDGFENKVKAFAYEESKRKGKNDKNEGLLTFADSTVEEAPQDMSADDIFNKYLK